MTRTRLAIAIAVLLVLTPLGGCATRGSAADEEAKPRNEVLTALAHYRESALEGNPSAVASLYTKDAVVSHESNPPIVGREQIRTMLRSFSAYKMLAYDLQADSTLLEGAVVVQAGHYRQSFLTPAGATGMVQGTFLAHWRKDANGAWLIQSMHTVSTARAAKSDQRQ